MVSAGGRRLTGVVFLVAPIEASTGWSELNDWKSTPGGLDSVSVRRNWLIAALLVGVASIVIAAIAMRLS
jgi:hypothetical protein